MFEVESDRPLPHFQQRPYENELSNIGLNIYKMQLNHYDQIIFTQTIIKETKSVIQKSIFRNLLMKENSLEIS